MVHETEIVIIIWVVIAIVILLASIPVYMTVIYHKQMKNFKEQEAENLLKISLEVEQRERIRIASDFHDGINGDLNALRNCIAILKKTEDAEQKETLLAMMNQTVNETQESVKRITYNLMPPLLSAFGLESVLKDYFMRFSENKNITITRNFGDKKLNITDAQAYELYRIIQELITNMTMHGKAENIDCRLHEGIEYITLTVSDDGKAFSFKESLKSPSGIGLKSISSRMVRIGAALTQPPSEKGNRLIIQFKKNG